MKKFLIKDKLSLVIAVLSMVIVVLVVLLVAFAVPKVNNSNDNTGTNVSQVERSVSGKTKEEDQKDAMAAAQTLLDAANDYDGKKTLEERLNAITDGDDSVADVKGMKSHIRFAGDFASDKELQTASIQSIITLASHLKNSDGKVEPLSTGSYNYVFLDGEIGVAFVPVSVFTKDSAFSLEMVYDRGEWKLAPYSLLDIVRLSAVLSGSSS